MFSRLCDQQRPLTAAMVRAKLDRILATVGIGETRAAVGQTARHERHEALMHEWGYSPLHPGHAANSARCEQAARLAGRPETGEPLGCGGSPGQLTDAHIWAFRDRGETNRATAALLHCAGVHEINLGDEFTVPVLPLPAQTAGPARLAAGA